MTRPAAPVTAPVTSSEHAVRSMVEPARRRGLADEAADRIREAIFGGVYPPGAQLREVDLATALDVSRGPVREALLRLQQEGLVSNRWHHSTTVTRLSQANIAEITSLRAALENLAVAQVVRSAGAEDLDAIELAAERMENARHEIEMVRLDIAFHDAVCDAARHQRLTVAWRAIRSQVHLFLLSRLEVSTAGYLHLVRAEHRQLVAALRARDGATASAVFEAHRQHAVDLLTAGNLDDAATSG